MRPLLKSSTCIHVMLIYFAQSMMHNVLAPTANRGSIVNSISAGKYYELLNDAALLLFDASHRKVLHCCSNLLADYSFLDTNHLRSGPGGICLSGQQLSIHFCE